jgi:hypothetical protein
MCEYSHEHRLTHMGELISRRGGWCPPTSSTYQFPHVPQSAYFMRVLAHACSYVGTWHKFLLHQCMRAEIAHTRCKNCENEQCDGDGRAEDAGCKDVDVDGTAASKARATNHLRASMGRTHPKHCVCACACVCLCVCQYVSVCVSGRCGWCECVCVCSSVCVWVSVSVSVPICVWVPGVCLCVCLCVECVCVSVSVSVSQCLRVSVSLCVWCLCVSVSVSHRVPVSVTLCLCVSLSLCFCVSVFLCLCVCVSVSLRVPLCLCVEAQHRAHLGNVIPSKRERQHCETCPHVHASRAGSIFGCCARQAQRQIIEIKLQRRCCMATAPICSTRQASHGCPVSVLVLRDIHYTPCMKRVKTHTIDRTMAMDWP